MSKVYVGDTGTLIELDTGASLTGATVTQIKARKPDGTVVTWTAAVSGTKVTYLTQTADLDAAGSWALHAYVETPSGKWTGEVAALQVYALYT